VISCLKLTQGLSWLTSIDSKLMNRFTKNYRGFPLHLLVFIVQADRKPLAANLPHEANVEQVFSRAGRISDPNMNPAYLGTHS